MKKRSSQSVIHYLLVTFLLTAFTHGCVMDDEVYEDEDYVEEVSTLEAELEFEGECVKLKGKKLWLNKEKALNCSDPSQCSDPNRNYLRECKKFVHADCFRSQGRKKVTGYHQGIAEGGTTNNHTWDNVEAKVKLRGISRGAENTITGYDSANCTGELFTITILSE